MGDKKEKVFVPANVGQYVHWIDKGFWDCLLFFLQL